MSKSVRVLILEDSPEDAELMVHELRRSQFEPEWRRVEAELEYSSQLAWPPEVILADYTMPMLDAPRALECLQELDLDIPFIVVSGAIGEDRAVEMMRRGATDYLLKDRMARLGPAVRRALDEKHLRDDVRKAEEALRASEVRFNSFMNHSPAANFIKDHQGRFLYINDTCEQMWGITMADCLGKTNDQLWPPEVAARLNANDFPVLQSGESSRMVEEITLKSGRKLQVLTFRFPFADADARRLVGCISVDVTEQVRIEQALSAALAAKEVLLREVHHRVKNNLQIISSLLTMHAESLEDPAATRALRDSQERVQCMALIHERLNRDDVPDRLDFREYVETLARNLFYSYGVNPDRINLRLELEPAWLGLNQAVPCGLILNELLTNSLKYAFPNDRKGEIAVTLQCGDDELVGLTVADNGVGLPEGFDWKQSQSLGLRIMNILARQLDGTLRQEADSGAAFSLVFPRAAQADDTTHAEAEAVSSLGQTA